MSFSHVAVTAYLDGVKFRFLPYLVPCSSGEHWEEFRRDYAKIYADYFRRGRDNKSI